MTFDDKSPLTSFLSPQPIAPEIKKQRTRNKWLAAAAVVLFVPAINSTLASDISLGSDEIEFGQGSNSATACDPTINVEVNNDWNDTDSIFEVTNFKLTGVDTVACLTKTLTVTAFDSSNQEIDLNGATTGASLTYLVGSNQGTNWSETITPGAGIDSSSIAKIIVQTS